MSYFEACRCYVCRLTNARTRDLDELLIEFFHQGETGTNVGISVTRKKIAECL